MDKYEKRRQNLKILIDQRCDSTAAEFARRIGRDASYVSRMLYEAGKAGRKRIADNMIEVIEKEFRLPRNWLDNDPSINLRSSPNVEPVPLDNDRVPLISFVQAGSWCEVEDNFEPGDAEDWKSCPEPHGPRSFALRVRGESMYNPMGEVSFRDGDIIFVDPDREAVHKSLVVAKVVDKQEATFKQLIIDGDKCYLKALNPSWPEQFIEIRKDTVICGVVFFVGRTLV